MDDDQLLAAVLKRFFEDPDGEDPDGYVYLNHHEAQDAWYLTIDAGRKLSTEEGEALQRAKAAGSGQASASQSRSSTP